MAKLIDVVAVYEMPASLQVSEGCFNKNFNVVIGGIPGRATTPSIAWNKDDRPYVVAPPIEKELKKHVEHYVINSKDDIEKWSFWGHINGWNPKKHAALKAHVGALLIHFKLDPSRVTYSDYLYGRGHPTGKQMDALFSEIDNWFERLSFWAEAAADQDVNPEAPLSSMEMRGGGLHVFTVEDDTISLPANSSTIIANISDAEKVNLPTLRRILKQANAGHLPSDAHMLLKEARAARRRHQYRRAVIDAGSATEITLADFNRRVTHVAISTRIPPTLGWYVNQRTIAARAVIPADAKTKLVDIRNNAIHQNQVPTFEETKDALAIAEQIVNNVDPLPL